MVDPATSTVRHEAPGPAEFRESGPDPYERLGFDITELFPLQALIADRFSSSVRVHMTTATLRGGHYM